MWRSTWRSLIAHKLRLAFSGLAIVLGVGFVSGTMIFTDTLNRTFTDLFASTAADVSVRPAATFDESMSGPSGTSTRVPLSLVDQVRAGDGGAAAGGDVVGEGGGGGGGGGWGGGPWGGGGRGRGWGGGGVWGGGGGGESGG